MGARYFATQIAACALLLLIVHAEQSSSVASASTTTNNNIKPLNIGPLKFLFLNNTNNGTTVWAFHLEGLSDHGETNLFTITNTAGQFPCIQSLFSSGYDERLDCRAKPEDEHRYFAMKYIKKTHLSFEGKFKLPFLGPLELESTCLLSQLNSQHVQSMIGRIAREHNLPGGETGFLANSFSSGYKLLININEKVRCEGLLYASINSTRDERHGEAEFFDHLKHLIEDMDKAGSLIGLRDFTCFMTNGGVAFQELSTSLVVRKQFPFFAHKLLIRSLPDPALLTFNISINQARTGNSASDYVTNLATQATSNIIKEANFNLVQNITNEELETGIDRLVLRHPKLTAIMKSDWTENITTQSWEFFFMKAFEATMLALPLDAHQDPKVRLDFRDVQEEKDVALKVTVSREVYDEYKQLFKKMLSNSQ